MEFVLKRVMLRSFDKLRISMNGILEFPSVEPLALSLSKGGASAHRLHT
jgi:hypothetical protein